jgi:hypothetical protein
MLPIDCIKLWQLLCEMVIVLQELISILNLLC